MLPSIPSKAKLPPCLPVGGCNADSIARQVHLIQEQNVVVVWWWWYVRTTLQLHRWTSLSLHNSINCIIVCLHLFAIPFRPDIKHWFIIFNVRIDPSTVNLHSTFFPRSFCQSPRLRHLERFLLHARNCDGHSDLLLAMEISEGYSQPSA